MYLKSIEVNGFKSFANKILFEFHDGITAIVGPNGSGKSNVADAVRWVLGEQSAKQLRGSNMQDVIFSGTELRRPQGFAYVAITLDNSDHKLPVDYNEVTVARRVYRSGESEYLMNGAAVRLRDVQELFFDTGIGKEGYSIIGQGQIDRIVSGRPEERRELLDEAAGIVKFKKRKAVAEKNLEEEQRNLSRITDIIGELEKQLMPLEKQQAVAKEYLKLKERLKCAEANQFLLYCEKSNLQKEELGQKQKIVADELAIGREAYENTKAEYEQLERQLDIYRKQLEQAKEEKALLNVGHEKTEGEIRLLSEQIETIRQNSLNSEGLLEEAQGNKQKAIQELERYTKEKQAAEEKLGCLEEDEAAAAAEIQRIRAEIASLNKEIEENNGEIFQILNNNANCKANIERYETMMEQSTIKRAELNKRAIENKSMESQEQLKLQEYEKALQEAARAVYAKKQGIQALEQKVQEEGKHLDEFTRNLEEKQKEYLRSSSKLDSLKNMTERYEGYGGSIRRVMEQKERYPGIQGVVADLMKVDKDYETAIETALGGSIQNIVTDNETTAKALIEFLKHTKAGRATFLPLTSITPSRNNNEAALREVGVLGLAASLVRADKQYSRLVQFLLGRIFVVDTIGNALKLAKKYNYTLRIVTLEGEQLNPGGSLSGGAYKNSSSLLSRRREIEELEKQVAEMAAMAEAMVAEKEERHAQHISLQRKVEQSKEEMRELYVQHNTAKMNLEQQQEKLAQIREGFGEFSSEMHEIEEQVITLKGRLGLLREEYEKNITCSKEKEARIDECSSLLKQKQAEEQMKNEEWSGIKAEFSGMGQNRQNILENMKRVREEIGRYAKEEGRLADSLLLMEKEKKEKEKEILQKREENGQNLSQSEQIEGTIQKLIAQKEEKNEAYKGFFAKREELSEKINMLDKEAFRLGSMLEKLEEAVEGQWNYMWEEYELTLSTAKDLEDDAFHDPAQNKKEISELKGKIKGLGDVNVNAIEDYRQLSERYAFLTSQRDDLHGSEQTLLGIISDLDEEMRRQFAKSFSEIREQFDSVFKELFGGGKATLELMEDADILEAGIRIIAQPPGKKLQNMMQLSGGEKALTAISLLFAIQNRKPSPFCLLDEIEAALDDSNVKRYAKYLHKLTKDTQFIVITHRRGTMAAADILYGITMQEKGVSTLVSVRLIEGELEK